MYEEEPKLKRRYSALLLILALLLGCLGGCASDKAAVTAAVGNSLKAYAAAFTSLVPQETFDREEGYRQDGDILLTALPDDYAFLEGAVRLRFAAASAKEGAPVEAEYSLELATMTLLTLSMRIENALTYLNCPQLLGEEWLGVAPETLPEDLERLGLGELELPDLAGLSAAAPGSQFELTDGEEDALEAAGKSVLAGLQVKRSGKESRDINVQPLDCQLYTVTLPAETVMVCFDALRAPLQRAMEENALSVAPGDGEEGETATPQEQLDALREAVDSLGDVSLTLGVAGQKVALALPQTYMNLSGESVVQLVNWYKPEMDQLLVCYDDIDLPDGKVRFRPSGSAGTHNGMRNIIYLLGRDDFPRMRVGTGRPPEHMDLKDYVLMGYETKELRETMFQGYLLAAEAIAEYIRGGADAARKFLSNPPRERSGQ